MNDDVKGDDKLWTPELVIALIEGAIALGHAFPTMLEWAKQRHPELRKEPLPGLEATERARAMARKRLGIGDDDE